MGILLNLCLRIIDIEEEDTNKRSRISEELTHPVVEQCLSQSIRWTNRCITAVTSFVLFSFQGC
jgi:hypothetical protein